MADKKTKTGFLGNWIIRNLLAALSIAVVLLVGAMIFLNVATKHNQELIVPDLSNMSVADADSIAVSEGMRIEVVDSVFVKRMKKGAVYRQNPIAGSKVKQGRRIALTITFVLFHCLPFHIWSSDLSSNIILPIPCPVCLG